MAAPPAYTPSAGPPPATVPPSTNAAQPAPEAVRQQYKTEIEYRLAQFSGKYEYKDFSSIVQEVFAADCKLLQPGKPAEFGREAVNRMLQSLARERVHNMHMTVEEVERAGDYGQECLARGSYTHYDRANQVLDQGKVICLWKRELGEWKIHWWMENSNSESDDNDNDDDQSGGYYDYGW